MGPILTCNRSQLCMESLCRPWAQEMNKIHPCPGEMTHKAHVPGGLSLQNVSIYNPAPGKVSSLACSPRLRNSIRLAQLAAFLCLQGPQFCCKNDSLCHCWVLYLKQRESLGNERFRFQLLLPPPPQGERPLPHCWKQPTHSITLGPVFI